MAETKEPEGRRPGMGRREFVLSALGACVGACTGCIGGAEVTEGNQAVGDVTTACCGIDCTDCGIRQAANDPQKAEAEAEAWRQRGHKDASPDWFQCQGCHGPDEVVWSGKCAIRRCCLRERRLANCSLCRDFPCEHIIAFEGDGEGHHRAAVLRLRGMRSGSA